jgi:rhamnosyltransferase
MAEVHAVVVAFRPDAERLRAALEAVGPQVSTIWLVENGPCGDAGDVEGVTRISLVSNRGLGAAQNVGIRRALAEGADHVLLLDQDSVPEPGMVTALVDAIDAAVSRGTPVAGAGPRTRESDGRPGVFVRFRPLRGRRVPCPSSGAVVQVDTLIGSGSLLPRAALEAVGEMDEGLFIYHIDTDWNLRARALGFAVLGVCAARMEHRHGEGTFRIPGSDARVVRYPPERHYYLFRASALLWRRGHAPWSWISADLVRLAMLFVFHALLVAPRRAHVTWMLRGLADGLRGRTGPGAAGTRLHAGSGA